MGLWNETISGRKLPFFGEKKIMFYLSWTRQKGMAGAGKRENIRFSFIQIFDVHKFSSPEIFHCRNSLLNHWLLSLFAHEHGILLTWFSDGTHTSRFCVHSAWVAGSLKLLLSTLKYFSSGSLRSLKSSDMFDNSFFFFFLVSLTTAFDFRVLSENVCIWRRNPLHGAGDIFWMWRKKNMNCSSPLFSLRPVFLCVCERRSRKMWNLFSSKLL